MKDFFVSYNKNDRQWAEWIAWQLEDAGYTTVIQAWDFRPGSNFVLDMQMATAQAERVIAVLSPDYLESHFTQPEWAAAFAKDPTGEKKLLLPIRVRECDLEGLLRQIVYIDLVGTNENSAKEALLEGVRRERVKPSDAPEFPNAPLAKRSVTKRPLFPGSLWNVPHRRNPHFTGRDSLLGQIRQALASGTIAALTQAITGLGGVGKTQLATEYAYRHRDSYAIVWWIRSEESATLASDYAELAESLELAEGGERDQNLIAAAVRGWLEANTGWLLVFDNANKPDELIDYLPKNQRGHVVITSRHRDWSAVASSLDVPVFERNKSIEFLIERTGESNRDAADRLADELGDFPLALEHAGAYIRRVPGKSMSRYLELFRTRRREIMQRDEEPFGYKGTVATTWEVSFQEVESESPGGAALLSLCAFLGPDDIPRDVVCAGAKRLPPELAAVVTDEIALDDAVASLSHYSLIESDENGWSVHRLVQAVMRDRMSEDEQKQWAEAAVEVINDAFPEESLDVRTWPVCDRLLSHALAAAEQAEVLQIAPHATGRLLNQVGLYQKGRARFAEAKAHYERALKIGEASYGPDHPNVAVGLNNLGSVLKALGDLEGAKAHYERALKIDEASYSPDHPNVAIRVNNLGSVLKELGELQGAKAHFERALKIDEASYGLDHPEVARDVNNLGSVLKELGDLEGAKAHLERALAICRKFLGDEHPNTKTVQSNLDILNSESAG